MTKVLVTESYLGSIADAIRLKNGLSTTYRPGDMAAAVEALDTSGIHPTGTKNITQNGTHDVTEYANANVNVQPNLQSKTANQNGTVTPDPGYDGLSSVVVDVSGGGSVPRLTIIDGNIVSDMSSIASAQYQGGNGRSTIPFVYKIKNNSSAGQPYCYGGSRNNSLYAFTRIGYQVGGMIIPIKIQHGLYSKICIECEVIQYGSGWRQANIVLTNSMNISNDGTISGQKTVVLASQDKTSEQINSQEGVVINSTSNVLLDKQTVEIDITGMSNDFFIGMWNCDLTIYVYSIYLE